MKQEPTSLLIALLLLVLLPGCPVTILVLLALLIVALVLVVVVVVIVVLALVAALLVRPRIGGRRRLTLYTTQHARLGKKHRVPTRRPRWIVRGYKRKPDSVYVPC